MADEACYGPLLGQQLRGFANESVAVEAVTRCALLGRAQFKVTQAEAEASLQQVLSSANSRRGAGALSAASIAASSTVARA